MSPFTACPGDEEILAAVRALQDGTGRDAFEVVYRRFYRSLFRFFANRPALRDEADDLAQATLIRAYENIHQYRFDGSFEGWLRHVAENVWKNAVRDRRAAKRGPLVAAPEPVGDRGGEAPPSPPEVRDRAPDPEQAVLAEERTQVLGRAIAALPPGMRRCAELRLFADFTYGEIAGATGIGLNSVRSQLFEARQRLKPVLDRYFQGADF